MVEDWLKYLRKLPHSIQEPTKKIVIDIVEGRLE